MAELLAVVTGKGQVTIPAEVRKALDIKRGDVVAFTLPDPESGSSTVRRAQSPTKGMVARTAGIFKHHGVALTPREEEDAAEQAWADEVVERMGGA
jgi:AbrB family looped-hinge helix DNA binding protein